MVHSVSLASFGCTLVVVGLIHGFWVHSGAPSWLLSSLGVFGFIRVHRGGRWVYAALLGSFGCAVGVVGCCWVHSGAPWESLGLLRVVAFNGHRFVQVRPSGRWVDSKSLDSFGCAMGSMGSLGVIGFIGGLWIHSGASWSL